MPSLPPNYTLQTARGLTELTPRTFHDIARLRQEVFVIEQECAYLDLDGRDAENTTEQFWIEAAPSATGTEATASPVEQAPTIAPTIAATLRVLSEEDREPGLHAVGRVATDAAHRGKGLAAALMTAVLAEYGSGPLVLEAQSHLTGWYGRFGFAPDGAEYLEDGIPHTPMRRPATGPATIPN